MMHILANLSLCAVISFDFFPIQYNHYWSPHSLANTQGKFVGKIFTNESTSGKIVP